MIRLGDTKRPDEYVDEADLEASLSALQAAIEPAASAGDGSTHLQLVAVKARVLAMLGRIDEAFEALHYVESRFGGVPYVVRVRHGLELGRACVLAGRHEQAIAAWSSAWEIGKSVGQDALAIEAVVLWSRLGGLPEHTREQAKALAADSLYGEARVLGEDL